MIDLKLTLANGDTLNSEKLADHIKDFNALLPILEREVIMHPEEIEWIEGSQTFHDAERDNEEDADGNAGGFLPYNQFGELIRSLPIDEQSKLEEDDYYYQVSEVEWEGNTNFESFVTKWMNENPSALKDVITYGCASGCVGSLIYTSDCLKVLAEHALDIQHKIQQIAEDFGNGEFMDFTDFSFDKLIWMCFEQTVREVLSNLQLDDI